MAIRKHTFLVAILTLALYTIVKADTPELIVYPVGSDADMLILAHYAGEQMSADDTLYKRSDGAFYLPKNSVSEGFYVIADFTTSKFIDVILSESDKSLTIKGNFKDLKSIDYGRSAENNSFQEFMLYLTEANKNIRAASKEGDENTIIQIKKENEKRLNALIKKYPRSVLATFAASQKELDIPAFEGTNEEINRATYFYRLDHFFDSVKEDPRYWTSRFFKTMPIRYIEKYTIERPDSIAKSMVRFLDMVEPVEEVFSVYLAKWINEYTELNKMNYERVWVTLTQEYVTSGRADNFIPLKAKSTMIDKASKQANCLIGMPAMDLNMPTLDIEKTLALPEGSKKYYVLSSPQSLYEQENSATILFFWKADCDHCQKAYPELIQLMQKYEHLGIGCYAVNTGSYKKLKEAAAFIKKHGGDQIYNMVDPTYASRYAEKYYFPNTPGIFILDEDKNIVFNRMGSTQLARFTEKALKDLGFMAK